MYVCMHAIAMSIAMLHRSSMYIRSTNSSKNFHMYAYKW